MKSTFNTNCMAFSTNASFFKKLLTVFAIAVGLTYVYNPALAQTDNDKPATAQVNADFPGGIDKFYAYILNNLKPDKTCTPGKTIYVKFIIDKDGTLKRAKVNGHDLSDDMTDQLVKTFESAPKWTPAQQNGHAQREHFVCPVMFAPKATEMMASVDVPKVQ